MDEAAVVRRLLDYPHMKQLLQLVQQADVGITDIDLQVTYNRDRLDV